MPDIISFYSVAPTQGKRTLSLSFANMLADQDNKVLYVELDIYHPSIANTLRITDKEKNANEYFHNVIMKNTFDLDSFVLKKENLMKTEERELKKIYSPLSSGIDYLVLPFGFKEESFPTILHEEGDLESQAHSFIEEFIFALKSTKYQYVILNLPNNIESIFGVEVLSASDRIVNVLAPAATRLMENVEVKNLLFEHMPDIKEKWFTCLNMISPSISENEYIQLLNDEPIFVEFDPERQKSEMQLKPDSESIRLKMEHLAFRMQISIVLSEEPKRKSIFRRG